MLERMGSLTLGKDQLKVRLPHGSTSPTFILQVTGSPCSVASRTGMGRMLGVHFRRLVVSAVAAGDDLHAAVSLVRAHQRQLDR